MFLFFEGFQPQNVMFFFFSRRHFHLLEGKVTPDVNDFLLLGKLGI